MIFYGINSCSLYIAFEADFKRNSVIINIIEQITIFTKSSAMADAVCITIVNGLMYRTRSITLTRMNSGVQIILSYKCERLGKRRPDC